MRGLIYTGQFKRDVKQAQKRGKDMEKLRIAIGHLVSGDALPIAYRDHALKGDWKPRRDLHIEPDWLLIYRIDEDSVRLERTGTHSDLFD